MNESGATDSQLIREALAEFVAVRTPVEKYVAKRYASHDQEFRDRKVRSVTARVAHAVDLLHKVAGNE